jgi:predicted RNA binding protein YcfA (HicA-like mRNA interferase family)
MSKLPVVTARQVVSALKKVGFVERRQRGSHLRMFNPRMNDPRVRLVEPALDGL